MKSPKPLYSYLSALALATVTISTFYVFQNFGPQSVLRRFHSDVARGSIKDVNWTDINAVTTGGRDDPATRLMAQFVFAMAAEGATYEIVDIKRLHREVLAGVDYRFPNGNGIGVVWHVVETPVDWRIDCRATYLGMQPQRLQ